MSRPVPVQLQSPAPPPPLPPPPNSFGSALDGSRPWFGVAGGLPPSYLLNSYPYNYAGYGGSIPYGTGYEQSSSPEGNFLRLAEESSRGAFRSIESLVSAVTSISNMLTSTHNAIFSSFRAVIGVVEQFRSLKYHVVDVILAALLRWIVYLWRRFLIALRVKPRNYAHSDSLWESIHAVRPASSKPLVPLNWPTVLFWLVALGGPYVIYRCVSQLVKSAEEAQQSWMKGCGEHYVARALYDFRASSQQELSMREGDQLRVAPKSQQPRGLRDWLLACSIDGDKAGFVPINYIKLVSRANSPTNDVGSIGHSK